MQKELFSLRNYAHLGDAVWELFVREYTVFKTNNIKSLHKITTDRVNAGFQKNILDLILPDLTSEEKELARRARNLPIPIARRTIQHDYRMATALETLLGFWFLHDKDRLEFFFTKLKETDFFS